MGKGVVDLRQLQEEYHVVTLEKITIGALIEANLGEEDGLVLKNGRNSRLKKIIIIGFDKTFALCFGSILINSDKSPRSDYSLEYLRTQYLLNHEDYPSFLKYDSYVDCGKLFAFPMEKLQTGRYCGELIQKDLEGIFEILETTDTLTTKEKKRFGIRRR